MMKETIKERKTSVLGDFVRKRRKLLGLKQLTVACESGVCQCIISNIERGVISRPQTETLRKLASALRVELDVLLEYLPATKTASVRSSKKERKLTRARSPVGNFIRKRRIEIGLKPKDLARKVGCSRIHIYNMECNPNSFCRSSDEEIQVWADALGVSLEDIKVHVREHYVYEKKVPEKAPESFAEFVKYERLKRGWSQNTLRDFLGLKGSKISDIERGFKPPKGFVEMFEKRLEVTIPTEFRPENSKTFKNSLEYGELVKAARNNRGYTISDLSRLSGISPNVLTRIELRGEGVTEERSDILFRILFNTTSTRKLKVS